MPNTASRNACFFFPFPFRGSLQVTWLVSRDSVKGSFPRSFAKKKKGSNRGSPIRAANVYYAVSLLDFLVLCYCKNKMSGKIYWF